MTEDQAIELLQLHALVHQDINHPKMESGFLGMVKYYDGKLNEDNFHEVMEAIRCLASRIRADLVERDIVANLHGICFCAWNWVVRQNGDLRRAGNVSEGDVALLHEWLDCIYWATTLLLDGEGVDAAFSRYQEYQGESVLNPATHSDLSNDFLVCA